ncbi:MAG: GPW/gp25 family protein [Lachnospiraceae bacterium]|nr:GPW/gp25 family protein [Lachnospiraceae bacterium]
MEIQEFLGTGMKFPPEIDSTTGRFKMTGGTSSVKESIYIILMTQKGERWIHPDFGTKSMSYVFTDISLTRLTMMQRELRDDILEFEPRVDWVEVNIEPQSELGRLIINIEYHIIEEDAYDNMVFPFYLNEERGMEESDEAFIGE